MKHKHDSLKLITHIMEKRLQQIKHLTIRK